VAPQPVGYLGVDLPGFSCGRSGAPAPDEHLSESVRRSPTLRPTDGEHALALPGAIAAPRFPRDTV
jgi:hypothetical protein